MKVFSQSPKGYLDLWKWGFVALFVVGLVRFFMEPIETGGKLMSLTIVLLVALIGYTAYFGWSGGKLGDVLVTAFALTIVYKCAFALSIAQLRTGCSNLTIPIRHTFGARSRSPDRSRSGESLRGRGWVRSWAGSRLALPGLLVGLRSGGNCRTGRPCKKD